jgi:UDP:flavonoid glycosyltransferase YjiC (YdhE family)
MRIIFTSFGSTGDVQPFLALATEMQRHGHEALFALPSNLLRYAQRLGFPTVQIGPDLGDTQDKIIRAELQHQLGIGDDQRAALWQPYIAAMPLALEQLLALCAEADLLISTNGMPLGRIVHDLTGMPFVSVRQDFPVDGIMQPTDADLLIASFLNPFRAQLGLAPLDDPAHAGHSPQLALFAVSQRMLQPQPDWPAHYHVTGSFFLDEPDWQPDPALAAFLEAGPAPVVVSLGSTMHDDPAALTRLVLDAIDQVGCRAIVQHGWTGLAADGELPPHIFATGYTPHSWLFPQAAAVIHHGGAGTTAAVFRAGVPGVVIPHVLDEFALARWSQEFGCAPAGIPYAELSVERLRAALHEALHAPRYREAAVTLAESIRAEQGVQTARLLIEQLVAELPPPARRVEPSMGRS